jgi:hypothetical protein
LKKKSEAFQAFKEWLVLVEKETGLVLKCFQTDNCGEYLTTAWIDFMKSRGICWETTTPHTPEQNGVLERLNQTLFNQVHTVLIDSKLPLSLWAEGVNYSIWTSNHVNSTANPDTTPFEIRFKRKPNLSCAHRFGCRAFLYNSSPKHKKLDPRAEEVIFVGYSETQKAFQFWRLKKRQCGSSIHIRFDDMSNADHTFQSEGEDSFQYDNLKASGNTDDDDSPPLAPKSPSRPPSPLPAPKPGEKPPKPPRAPHTRKPPPPPRPPSACIAENLAKASEAENPLPPVPDPDPGGATETEPELNPPPHEDTTIPSDTDTLSDILSEFTYVIAAGEEPCDLKEVKESPDWPEWELAIHKELESIAQLGTYKLVVLPPGRKAIGSKWVFHIKCDSDRNISSYKGHVYAKGFTKIPGLNFTQAYAPVAKIEHV